MISFLRVSKQKILAVVLLISVILFFNNWIPLPVPLNEVLPTPQKALATYQFTPTGGGIVTGTTLPILGITAANTEGTNLGDWRATIADDNLHFGINSTATGYNVHLDLGGVQLNNANKLFIQTEFDLDATAPATLIQICDWVSNVGVHNVADTQCTGGGWRNLNVGDTAITGVAVMTYNWAIYNGYWDATATTRIDTPLANFVSGTNMIRIRYFSTTNSTSAVHIDYLRVFAVVNPVYSASGAVNLGVGAVTGNYSTTVGTGIGTGQTGLDDARFQVAGTAATPPSFYMSFTDVRAYPGANTIMARAEYSCSTTGINFRPRIFNFSSGLWENLTNTDIACTATDAINIWARNNIPIADYISNGEVRIGWFGLANNALGIRIDMMYIMIGSTNTSGVAEITLGTNAAGSVVDTRNIDTTGTTSTWNVATVVESNTLPSPIYALDSDHDTTAEQAAAMNIDFPVAMPAGSAATGIFFAGRFMAGAAGTVQMGLRDYGGSTSTTGGWTAVGATPGTSLTYTDNITVGTVASEGVAGMNLNPKDHMDTVNNRMNIRLRSVSPTTGTATRQWDFAMVSIQWAEVPVAPPPEETLTFSISDNTIGFGPLSSGSARFATGDTNGSGTEVEAHNLTASTTADEGYVIAISGTTLTFGAHTITAIGVSNTASSPGTEQFGARAVASGGIGAVSAPYSGAGFALDTANFPDEFASATLETATTTFSVHYVANIATMTEAGSYTANLTYTATGRF